MLDRGALRPAGGLRDLECILVPTHRRAARLRLAFTLAAGSGCPIVVVRGGESDPDEVFALADEIGVSRCYVVRDVDALAARHLPMAVRSLHESPAKQRYVAAARNLGLSAARLAGCSNVLFLDDDVEFNGDLDGSSRPATVRETAWAVARAAHALHEGAVAVGWTHRWYPDNSVVCHANRLANNPQESFVGAGSLLVRVDDAMSFFPPIYNEDWLFLFDAVRARRLVRAGNALQLPFDPFADPERAADEELGDLLAEGLYHLLHLGLDDAELASLMLSEAFWADEIAFRRRFVAQIADQLQGGAAPEGADIGPALASLKAAAERLVELGPEELCEFVRAWREDVQDWRATMRRFHPLDTMRTAFDVLHVPYETTRDEQTR